MICFHSMVERRNLHLTYIERPELIRMLNEGLKTKLTIVTSPAGYGKTTILSQWVEQCGITAEWVSLDRQDNDLVQFWSYVIEAVETNIPNFSKDMSPHLTTLKSGAFEPFIKALLNEFGRISHELGFIS